MGSPVLRVLELYILRGIYILASILENIILSTESDEIDVDVSLNEQNAMNESFEF